MGDPDFQKGPDSEFVQRRKRKKRLGASQTTAKSQSIALLESQDESLTKLRTGYDVLARNALSTDFNGCVGLTSEGIEFRVFRGENLSSDAFETLSILLANIAVLLMGSLGSASHSESVSTTVRVWRTWPVHTAADILLRWLKWPVIIHVLDTKVWPHMRAIVMLLSAGTQNRPVRGA